MDNQARASTVRGDFAASWVGFGETGRGGGIGGAFVVVGDVALVVVDADLVIDGGGSLVLVGG